MKAKPQISLFKDTQTVSNYRFFKAQHYQYNKTTFIIIIEGTGLAQFNLNNMYNL